MTTKVLHDNAQVDNNEIALKSLLLILIKCFKYLLSKRVVILLFVAIGGICGYYYAYFKKPVYMASSTFVLEEADAGSGFGSLGGLASMVGIDMSSGGGLFQGDNIIELYKSRSMIKKTLLTPVIKNGKSVLLVDEYVQFNKLKDKWSENKKLIGLHFNIPSGGSLTRLQDSVLIDIIKTINKENLIISKPDKKLSIIRVDVKAADELFAKKFNDEIVANVNDFYIQTRTKRSLQNVQILQQKTDSVRAVMNGAIYSVAAISDATPNLNPTRQIQRTAPMQRSQYSAETNKAILSELVKNLELSKISLRKETPLIQIIDQPVFPLDVDKLGKVKGALIGAFLLGFLTVLTLIINKFLKDVMA